MNIYIYGNHSFKKEIHETLEHSNIKFKLDANSVIKEIDELSELKKTIKDNPKDIYLIDDEKIIKKNSLNTKIKFLAPKDGIEEEFLLDSGIADLSVNSLSEIPKYILRKHEEEKQQLDPNIQASIANIVDEAYEKENIELDEELSQLLAKEDIVEEKNENEVNSLDDIFDMPSDVDLGIPEDVFSNVDDSSEISKEELDDIMNFNDNFGLNNISLDYDDKNIEDKSSDEKDPFENFDNEENEEDKMFDDLDFLEDVFNNQEEKTKEEDIKEHVNEKESLDESLQGEGNMSNDKFFELDSLNEEDLLDALNCTVNKKVEEINTKDLAEKNTNSINITNSSNTDELAQLISKLLSNKTLEITIKIKD
ncbi:hypothetical protein [Arcobacter sp. s6]|uniref:hypothetical protein n=1 Tax=Arcobacter sp. s6 TaxID=3230363 RepID=UPI0034A003EC